MIEINCPHCGHLLRIPDQYAGQQGGCKHCRGRFQVPVPESVRVPPPSPFEPTPVADQGMAAYQAPVQQVPGVRAPASPAAVPHARGISKKLVTAIVCASLLILGVLVGLVFMVSPKKAETPDEALVNFATAFEEGSVRKMLAAAHYTDEECTRAMFELTLGDRAFEKALDEAYGEARDGQMQMTTRRPFPTLEQIHSDDLIIEEEGDRATARISGEFGEGTSLIKKDGNWYVDAAGMMADMPEGAGREQILKVVEGLSQAVEEAKAKIGRPGQSRQAIEMGLLTKSMGVAMAGAMESFAEQTGPAAPVNWDADVSGPPPSEEEILSIVRQINDAMDQRDLATLRQLIVEDCQMDFGGVKVPYWGFLEQSIEASQGTDTKSTIEEATVVEKSANQATVRVTSVSVSSSPVGSSRATATYTYTFKKYGGKWKAAELKTGRVRVSMGDVGEPGSPGQPAGGRSQFPGQPGPRPPYR